MSEITERDYLPASPYPGIEPFSYAHRNVFFSRAGEARALLQLVVIYRGVLLYSESGVGKSSLVNAGLIPRIMAEGYQPEMLRIQPRKGQEIIVERLFVEATEGAQCLPSLFAADQREEDTALSVEEFMETVRQKADSVRPLLIFDQFEEWTTLFEEGHSEYSTGELRQMQQAILEAMVALLNDRQLPVKLLIVLREDYLAQLTPLFERCPTLVDQYLRLTPLDGEQVFRTIRGPFDDFPGRYQPEISAGLAQTIRDQFEERTRGADIRLTEVQIVCRSLFESAEEGSDPDQKFATHGNVQGLLEEYLMGALKSLPVDQQDPAVELLTRMVTAAGTRKRISQDDLLTQMRDEGFSQEIVIAALDSLERRAKLVRQESLRMVAYYEIASEFLVSWIQRHAEARRLQRAQAKAASEARTRAEQEARERERELVLTRKSKNRLALLGAALAIACLAAAAAAVQARYQRKLADTGATVAAKALLDLQAARLSATAQKKEAEVYQATAHAANIVAATGQAGAATAGTAAAVNETKAVMAMTTGEAIREFANVVLETQVAAIEEQLTPTGATTEAPGPGPPTVTQAGVPSSTDTPTPTPTEGVTPSPTPRRIATPTPTADRGATATVQALETQLESIRATQTAVAALVPLAHPTVLVPKGCFLQGSTEEQIAEVVARCRESEPESEPDPAKFCAERYFEDELPQHEVCLDAFSIDQHEVTNEQYEDCVQAKVCSPPKATNSHGRDPYFGDKQYADYPVIWVSWHDAVVYCAWVGMRLPTEAEWEKAAHGDGGAQWPWGDSFSDGMCNTRPQGVKANALDLDTVQVGSLQSCASLYGAMDMVGNVWEWTADWYGEGYYNEEPGHDPQGPPEGEFKVTRGGSWNTNAGAARAALRTKVVPEKGYMDFGFRCASD